jgi:hypothetical protein
MGAQCCSSHSDLNKKNKKLIRLIKKNNIFDMEKFSTLDSFSENRIHTESDKSNENFLLQIFDIEEEILFFYSLNLKIKSLEGISQIFYENTLILCGSNTYNDNTKNTNSFSSSFMYSIDIFSTPLKLNFQVNSCFPHYYPILSILRNEFVLVISGKGSTKCEYYSLTNKRWKDLPELPESRYGGSLICDNTLNIAYIFGGENEKTNKNSFTIFKLNINKCIKWDTIIIEENSHLLTKKFSGIIKIDNENILILGGKNNDDNETDEVVNINIIKRKIKVLNSNKKLNDKIKFKNLRIGIENNKGKYYIFDDDKNDVVIRIDDKYINEINLEQNNMFKL